MNEDALKESIKRELPGWLRTDPDLRAFILELTRSEYANRAETGDRFYEMLAELRRDREEQARKWEESRREFQQVHEEIMAQARRFDRSTASSGACWWLEIEKAFHDALAGILEDSFGVKVIRIKEYDDAGEVFGRPDEVELDIITRNDLLIFCELKSSIDKARMYSFERKARFYERRHGRKADRLIVISPMIDARAQQVAKKLGIETYSDSTDVESL